MAHHRAGTGRRGISRGLIFAALFAVLIGALAVLWWQIGYRVDKQGDQAAGTCVEGKATAAVIADPDLTEALRRVADSYNKTGPVVRDHCVTIDVRPGDSRITYQGLHNGWDPQLLGGFPAAWVPQSSVWSSQLSVTDPKYVDGTPQSLVTSPIVLAVAPEFAQKAAGQIAWGELPTLARSTQGLEQFGLKGWGGLRLAMPTGPNSDATALAAQGVATAVTRSQGMMLASDAESARVRSSIDALRKLAPSLEENSAAWAADSIATAANPAAAPIHAVPITEAQLYVLSRASKSGTNLRELIPTGAAPLADFPIVHLRGDKVSPTQADAIADFFAYVRKAEQMSKLTALGFRGDGALPQPTAAVTFPVIPNPMPVPEPGAVVAINNEVYPPA